MYYVMEPYVSEHQYLWFREGPDDDGEQWRTGERMVPPPAAVELASENEDHLPLADMVSNHFGLHVFSPRLRATLEAMGVTQIQYVPARLVDRTSGVQHDEYRVANYLARLACLDFANSHIQKGTRIPIVGVDHFALLEEKIVAPPGSTARPRIFRLGEDDLLVIAHQSVKDACDHAGIVGIQFTPTTEYA